MSNILIIKHGSLGDIAQISGVIRDIRENNKDRKIFILTTPPYVDLMSRCPFIDYVLIDRRLPRWNLFYLFKLKKMIQKYNFSHVYDLQNSSRTTFYRKFLINITNWSSTETRLDKKIKKDEFDKEPVLERFNLQLKNSEINTKFTLNPDFSWACQNVDEIIRKYTEKKIILIFPFCSPQLSHKQWPYFNDLIKIIKEKHEEFAFVTAPSASEVSKAYEIDATPILNNKKALNIMEVAGLIKKSSFIIANDTGPAHMSAHLNKNGIVLFGHHTTAKKVSIETDKFKAIQVDDLSKLSAEQVYKQIQIKLV